MDLGFLPDEWLCSLIIAVDERLDVRLQFADGGEGRAGKRLSGEDREPDFHLIEPGRLCGREVEVNVRMAFEPAVFFGLMGVEVVEDDMDFAARMCGGDPVHEVQKLDPAPPFVLPSRHLAGGDIERREQSCGSVPLVIVALPRQGAPVGKLEIALFAFQSLDGGLFVDGEHQGVARRIEIKPHDFGRLRRKIGVVALAPAFARGKIDLLGAKKAPDILHIDIAKSGGDQRSRPARIAIRARGCRERPECVCPSPLCIWDRCPGCRSHRAPPAAFRRSAPAISRPYPLYSPPRGRLRALEDHPPPKAQSAPAGAADVPFSSSGPRRQARPALLRSI